MDEIDNTTLEELMKEELTVEMQNRFFEILKESQLFMPVTIGSNMFEGIEDANVGDVVEPEGGVGFDINYLTDSDGNKAVPLFTSSEVMESVGIRSSVIGIYMSDLAYMLKQTDKYAILSINPFTEHDVNMPMGAFLSQFMDEIKVEDVNNDRLRELLSKKEVTEEFAVLLLKSEIIVGCIEDDKFALIWNQEKKPYLPMFTDIDEFKKMFDGKDEVIPKAYDFIDFVNAQGEVVINPASESLILDPKKIKEMI